MARDAQRRDDAVGASEGQRLGGCQLIDRDAGLVSAPPDERHPLEPAHAFAPTPSVVNRWTPAMPSLGPASIEAGVGRHEQDRIRTRLPRVRIDV